MRILLTGRSGQVGSELVRTLAPLGEVIALDRSGLDLRQPEALGKKITELQPRIIVNAAAYTAVDRAETERAEAFAVNAEAPGVLAGAAMKADALLVHFSTDYVFDGEKVLPYVETDAVNPLNVYGESKLEGERRIAATGCRHLIFRTAWVYAARGRNFLLSILAAARSKPELRVVDDQRGAPTSAGAIARGVAAALSRADLGKGASGIYHLTAGGETTWHGFAAEILARKGVATPLHAIPSAQFPTPARRPKNSLLDNAKARASLGVALPDWREQLDAVIAAVD